MRHAARAGHRWQRRFQPFRSAGARMERRVHARRSRRRSASGKSVSNTFMPPSAVAILACVGAPSGSADGMKAAHGAMRPSTSTKSSPWLPQPHAGRLSRAAERRKASARGTGYGRIAGTPRSRALSPLPAGDRALPPVAGSIEPRARRPARARHPARRATGNNGTKRPGGARSQASASSSRRTGCGSAPGAPAASGPEVGREPRSSRAPLVLRRRYPVVGERDVDGPTHEEPGHLRVEPGPVRHDPHVGLHPGWRPLAGAVQRPPHEGCGEKRLAAKECQTRSLEARRDELRE